MKATIRSTGETVSGKSLRDIQRKMMRMLRIDGPRGLTAKTEDGAEIHTELYDGQDYIKTASGRVIK